MNAELIPYLDRRLDKLEQKVDTLISFKWQIVGGAAVISTVFSVVMTLLLHFISK